MSAFYQPAPSYETKANGKTVAVPFLSSEFRALPGTLVPNNYLIDLKVTFIVQDFWLNKILKSNEDSKL